MNINHLITMGGYGLYVWPAYGITLSVFFINLLMSLKEKQAIRKALKEILTHCSSQ